MSKTHPPYAPEYRRQMVELVRAGRSAGELAREFGCCAQTIRNWVRQTGGWLGRTRDPPGAQLMWHGYTQLVAMAFAFELRDEYG